MKIKVGCLYHIKDEFFSIMNDEKLMCNHEKGRKRPTYFTLKDKEFLWFIPISSKVEKYKKIINNKIKRYGFCNTILIRKVAGKDTAILLQNAFPILEKYIDHVHTINGVPVYVQSDLIMEINFLFRNMIGLKNRGVDLFFVDVDVIKERLLHEFRK